MPGLDFEKLPAEQVQEIKGTLHGQWQIEANALNKSHFTNKGQFETAKAKLNSKYQQMELQALTELQQQVTEQQRVRQLIEQPQQRSPADEAQLKMQLRPEAESLVFPSEPGGAPYGQASMGKYAETIRTFAKRADEKRGVEWGPPEKKRESLINEYQAWQERYGYEGMNFTQKNQMDDLWDSVMAEDKDARQAYKQWDPQSVQVKSLRSRGKISKAMSQRVNGTPIKYDTTPAGKSIIKEKPAEKTQTQKPIRQRNRRTGQERISNDGGKTWQMIG